VLDDLFLASNHHAITTFQTPDAAACANVDIKNLLGSEMFCPLNVIHVVGIPSVDQDVSWFEVRKQISDGLINNRGRNHQPHCAWFC